MIQIIGFATVTVCRYDKGLNPLIVVLAIRLYDDAMHPSAKKENTALKAGAQDREY